MITELTVDLLRSSGFDEEVINRFQTWEKYEHCYCNPPKDCVWASNIENKVYSGIDGYRKHYFINEWQIAFPEHCLDLYPEFISLKLNAYLLSQRDIAMSLFNEKVAVEAFFVGSTEYMKKRIHETKAEISASLVSILANQLSVKLNRFEWCLAWLENTPIDAFILPVEFLFVIKSATRIKFDGFLRNIKSKCFEEKEYEQIATMFTDFFEGCPVTFPIKEIAMKNGSKTEFAQLMGIVHKQLAKPKVIMKENKIFYDIFRTLSQFNGETNAQIYAALKR